ncbi:MAG: two-component system, LytTR family, response regulator [Bacteroidota bacterium]|nr:two-component system, LytTR family, response regulator [Bacteroidota bacterium]
MKVVIVEDEKLSAEHLCLLLQRIDKSIEVIKYLDTVKGTINAFQEGLEANLLFLDIHLADGNSFEIFNQIYIDTPIIFTTAYDQYAIQAFKQNSIDYLLKPISLKDVQFALEKYKKQEQKANKNLIENITIAYQQLNKPYKTRFLVKKGQTIESILTTDIHHFETEESISFLTTNKGNRYPIDFTLDQLETLLQPKNFFRINRKIIIHIQSIEKVNTYFNSRLSIATKFLDADSRVVSRDRVTDFKLWLDS